MGLPIDCTVMKPAMQEAGTPLQAITLNVVRAYFTELIDVGNYNELVAFLNVTAASGSPTLDIKMQYSPDGINWMDSGDSFTQVVSTTGLTLKKMSANFGKYIRFRLDVGGTTPSYTISLYLVGKGA